MTHTNVLNRKLEEVYGVGKEFTTVAALWGVSPLASIRGKREEGRADNLGENSGSVL